MAVTVLSEPADESLAPLDVVDVPAPESSSLAELAADDVVDVDPEPDPDDELVELDDPLPELDEAAGGVSASSLTSPAAAAGGSSLD